MSIKRPIIRYSNVALIQSDSPCHTTAANSGDNLSFLPSVQAIGFSFEINRSQEGSIGSRNFSANSSWRSPDLNFNISTHESFGSLFSNLNGAININGPDAISNNIDSDRNFYALISDDQKDDALHKDRDFTPMDVLSFGNCFLTDVSISQSVAGFLTSEYSFVGSNMQAQNFDSFTTGEYAGGSGKAPSFNLTGDQSQNVPVVFNKVPADFPKSFASGFFTETGKLIPSRGTSITLSNDNTIAKIDSIQNFTLNFPIPRKSIYGIGKKNPVTRKSIFPSMGTLNISSFVSGILVTGRSSNLREFLAVDENYTITMVLQNLQNKNQTITLKDVKLKNNDYSVGIGEYLSCSLNFDFPVNSASATIV